MHLQLSFQLCFNYIFNWKWCLQLQNICSNSLQKNLHIVENDLHVSIHGCIKLIKNDITILINIFFNCKVIIKVLGLHVLKSMDDLHPPMCHVIKEHGVEISIMLQLLETIITNSLMTCGWMTFESIVSDQWSVHMWDIYNVGLPSALDNQCVPCICCAIFLIIEIL